MSRWEWWGERGGGDGRGGVEMRRGKEEIERGVNYMVKRIGRSNMK